MPSIDLSKKSDKEKHDKLVNLVDSIMELNKKLFEENNPNTKTMLRRRAEAIDGEIDRIVYKLYDLTEEEIKIVEGWDMAVLFLFVLFLMFLLLICFATEVFNILFIYDNSKKRNRKSKKDN